MKATTDALTQLPLFPLRSVLFPDGLLPLQIFEVRYLEMIARRHRQGLPFGVVCLSTGSEVQRPPAEAGGEAFAAEVFHPIGTLARIDELQNPHPGLLIVRCTGTQRFRLLRSARQKFGLWVGDAEPIADDAEVAVPDDLAIAREALRALIRDAEAERKDDPEARAELPWRRPYRWDDCGWLANRWCEVLPLAVDVRQRFMTIGSPVVRLELVADVLREMGLVAPGAAP